MTRDEEFDLRMAHMEQLIEESSLGPTKHIRDQVPDSVVDELLAKVWEILGYPGERRRGHRSP